MTFFELQNTEYYIKYLAFVRQPWYNGESWSCIGHPKEQHLLILLDGCRAVYTMRDGREYHFASGDLAFVPMGSEYRARFYKESDKPTTAGVNFMIYGMSGELLPIDDVPVSASAVGARSYINEIERMNYSVCRRRMKYNLPIYSSLDYLFDELSRSHSGLHSYELISVGAEYLNKHFNEDVSVSALASMCNISEVYFRRLFKEQTGKTPTEYRNGLRFERSAEYLKYSNMSIRDIAERLGFVDTSYFVKRFKESFGISPLAYRKLTNSNKLER